MIGQIKHSPKIPNECSKRPQNYEAIYVLIQKRNGVEDQRNIRPNIKFSPTRWSHSF